jgi:hypothetical protein
MAGTPPTARQDKINYALRYGNEWSCALHCAGLLADMNGSWEDYYRSDINEYNRDFVDFCLFMFTILWDTRLLRPNCGDSDANLGAPPPNTSDRPKPQLSPIVLDFNKNDVVDTVGLPDEVYFDHDGNRFAERTGWLGQGDAFLVRDLNGNGQIDDGGELFGDKTLLANGQKAANGFAALADLDSNNDGVIDQNDEFWSELRLWFDWNSDGKVDSGEWAGDAASSGYGRERGNSHR